MLAICSADKPVAFKAPKPSSNVERAPQGIKPGAKPRHKKHSTSSKQPSVSSKEATKASFIIHSKSASGSDASAASTAEADPGNSAPSTGLHVLADQTKSVSEGLEIVLTQPLIGKGASLTWIHLNDPIIVVDDNDEDEEADKVHDTANVETEDTSHKLEVEKNKAEAKVAILKAQPSFPIVGWLNELLIKSLQTKFLKILSAHDFSSSLPTELKDLPSKFNELAKEGKGLKKQVHELDIKLPGYLKEIPSKLEDFTKTITSLTSQVAELKTL
ncbi:hypothetical protein Tco_1430696 [Tanacetum coccineum]